MRVLFFRMCIMHMCLSERLHHFLRSRHTPFIYTRQLYHQTKPSLTQTQPNPTNFNQTKPNQTPKKQQVALEEIRYEILVDVLTYLYTDAVRIDLHNSFELFQVRW